MPPLCTRSPPPSCGVTGRIRAITRNRPADGSVFRDYQVVRAEIGPKLPTDEWPAARGGLLVGIERPFAGILPNAFEPA